MIKSFFSECCKSSTYLLSGLHAGECFVWLWRLMKTPISRYLTLVTALTDLTLYWLDQTSPDIGHCLRSPENRDRDWDEPCRKRERSNNAFSAETGHKFSRSSTRHDLVKHVGSEDERSHSNFSLLFPFWNMKRLNYFSPRSVCVRPDCDPGQVRDLVITKLVTQSRSRGILSPADRHTLKQKLHPDPFIIIVFNGHVVCSCDGIISKWSPGANIIVSCSDN